MKENKAYTVVNEMILEQLEKGIVPWSKPWKAVRGVEIQNYESGKGYSGINPLVLSLHSAKYGLTSPFYATFKQIKKAGGKVKKGSKGCPVIYWNITEKEIENESGETEIKKSAFIKYYNVFSLEQTEGIEWTGKLDDMLDGMESPIRDKKALYNGYIGGPSIDFVASNSAYYSTSDFINMPDEKQFKTESGFYGTLHHELIHSTGHKNRLNRPFSSSKDKVYAKEELIAESGAAYLNHYFGLDIEIENTAAYIDGWKKRIGDDPTIVVSAFGKAEKAADYIIERIKTAPVEAPVEEKIEEKIEEKVEEKIEEPTKVAKPDVKEKLKDTVKEPVEAPVEEEVEEMKEEKKDNMISDFIPRDWTHEVSASIIMIDKNGLFTIPKRIHDILKHCVSTDDSRYFMKQVFFDSKNKNIVSTDGRKLVLFPLPVDCPELDGIESGYYDLVKIGKLYKLVPDCSNLGQFPNYSRVIPDLHKDYLLSCDFQWSGKSSHDSRAMARLIKETGTIIDMDHLKPLKDFNINEMWQQDSTRALAMEIDHNGLFLVMPMADD